MAAFKDYAVRSKYSRCMSASDLTNTTCHSCFESAALNPNDFQTLFNDIYTKYDSLNKPHLPEFTLHAKPKPNKSHDNIV